MEKLYYGIGEVAEILGESTSLVRFWTNSFAKFLSPKRNAKGNRLYTAAEIETLKQIHFLVRKQGLTLDGAAQRLAEGSRRVESRVQALNTLKEIRAQLVEIHKSL